MKLEIMAANLVTSESRPRAEDLQEGMRSLYVSTTRCVNTVHMS